MDGVWGGGGLRRSRSGGGRVFRLAVLGQDLAGKDDWIAGGELGGGELAFGTFYAVEGSRGRKAAGGAGGTVISVSTAFPIAAIAIPSTAIAATPVAGALVATVTIAAVTGLPVLVRCGGPVLVRSGSRGELSEGGWRWLGGGGGGGVEIDALVVLGVEVLFEIFGSGGFGLVSATKVGVR